MKSLQPIGNTNRKRRSWSFTLFGVVVLITVSRPRTTWWNNDYKYLVDKSRRPLRTRQEKLFAFCRVYYRTEHLYAYEFILGRLAITWSKL